MKTKLVSRCLAVVLIVSVALVLELSGSRTAYVQAADTATTHAQAGWDPAAAARYLDGRETWWQSWDHAQKDHGTLCVSCHTQAPYALARPALRPALGEHGPSAPEQAMLASVEKRVRSWKDMRPFYSDAIYGAGKEIESRAAESVLNAVILASYDARQDQFSETARLALDNAWALQLHSGPDAGAWTWQNFGYTPWESNEAQYHWAALLAVALVRTPATYRAEPKISANVAVLTGYLPQSLQHSAAPEQDRRTVGLGPFPRAYQYRCTR